MTNAFPEYDDDQLAAKVTEWETAAVTADDQALTFEGYASAGRDELARRARARKET